MFCHQKSGLFSRFKKVLRTIITKNHHYSTKRITNVWKRQCVVQCKMNLLDVSDVFSSPLPTPQEKLSTTYPGWKLLPIKTFHHQTGTNKWPCVIVIKNTHLKSSCHRVETTTVSCPTQNVTMSSEDLPSPRDRSNKNDSNKYSPQQSQPWRVPTQWMRTILSQCHWTQSGGITRP